MALRTSLVAQPHLYMGDTTGRPLDGGKVYFGQVNKDPELYPIDVFYDSDLTIAATQPISTKGGFLNANGDMVEVYALNNEYSVKALDSYNRVIFYKPNLTVKDRDTLKVISDISDLAGFGGVDGIQINVANPYSGIWTYSTSDMSIEVAGDTNQDFYIAPINDSTGTSGAWVRTSGIPASNSFANPAPDNARLFSTIDSQEYIYSGGLWIRATQAIANNLATHVQDGGAHGLKSTHLAIGSGSTTATGVFPIAIGANVVADGGYAFGRLITSDSQLSTTIGAVMEVTASDQEKYRSNLTLANNSFVIDCNQTTVLGNDVRVMNSERSICFAPNNLLDNIKTSVILLPRAIGSTNAPLDRRPKYANKSVIIGDGASIQGSDMSPVENSIALGCNATANFNASVAIGYGAEATSVYDFTLGSVNHKVRVSGSLSVTGSKNFKIPHPLPSKKETHYLVHSSYEGDCEGGTIYRHNVTTVDGTATKELPDWFKYLNKDVVVYVTPHKNFGAAYGEVVDNTLTITSNADGDYNVLIMGTRNDDAIQNWEGVEVAK